MKSFYAIFALLVSAPVAQAQTADFHVAQNFHPNYKSPSEVQNTIWQRDQRIQQNQRDAWDRQNRQTEAANRRVQEQRRQAEQQQRNYEQQRMQRQINSQQQQIYRMGGGSVYGY